MATSRTPRPTILQSASLLAVGVIVTLAALRRVMAAFNGEIPELPLAALIALSAGMLAFSFGFMMLIVVLARPLFGKRPQDERAEAAARKGGSR